MTKTDFDKIRVCRTENILDRSPISEDMNARFT